MSFATHRKRSAYTLLDMIFVMICVLLLAALVFPALQASQEMSRQSDCAMNLKMLGLACHNYHDVYKAFPAMRLGTYRGEGEVANQTSNRYCMSGLVCITPFLEQAAVFDRARQRNYGPVPWRHEPDTWAVQIPVFVCPSDQLMLSGPTGNASYKFSMGTTVIDNHLPRPGHGNGAAAILGDPRRHRSGTLDIADFLDGTSNTLLMSERRIGNRQTPDDIANVAINVAAAKSDDPEVAYDACWATADAHEGRQYNDGQEIRSGSRPGERWADGRPYFAGFTSIMTPNTASCLVEEAHGGSGVFTASSRHPDAVQVLMADGSVWKVDDGIQRDIWWALGTRNGREQEAQAQSITSPPERSRLLSFLRGERDLNAQPLQDPRPLSDEEEQAEQAQLDKEEKKP